MKLYTIRDWNTIFENNRSRTVEDLRWVAIPNRHDGENYAAMITHKDGAEMFAAWCLCVQVASRCRPRGSLLRGGKIPHDPASLSTKTRAPQFWFKKLFDFLEKYTDWLVITDVAVDCQAGDTRLSGDCQSGDEGGMEGIGGNGKDGRDGKSSLRSYSPESRVALFFLNEKTGSKFRETADNLGTIDARLKEPEVSIEGVKIMITRQCILWGTDSKMSQFLRPATLFGKQKFGDYYALREVPIPTQTYQRDNPGRTSPGAQERQRHLAGQGDASYARALRAKGQHEAADIYERENGLAKEVVGPGHHDTGTSEPG